MGKDFARFVILLLKENGIDPAAVAAAYIESKGLKGVVARDVYGAIHDLGIEVNPPEKVEHQVAVEGK